MVKPFSDSAWSRFFGTRKTSKKRRRRFFDFEALEDRIVPATLTISDLQDNTDADGELSIREAINAVNNKSTAGLDSGAIDQIDLTEPFGVNDTIEFPGAGLFQDLVSEFVLSQDVIIIGSGQEYFPGGSFRHFTIEPGVTVELHELNLSGSIDTPITNAGSILNQGTLTIVDTNIFDNVVAGNGGAIVNEGTLTIRNSAIYDNSISPGGGSGGGIWNEGNLTIESSTISGNSAWSSGGGIGNANSGSVKLTATTVAGNSANQGGGIFNSGAGGSLTLTATIVATNTGGATPDISGTVTTDDGFNLIGDALSSGGLTDGSNNNLVGVDPMLSDLDAYGGLTLTHKLLDGSPALDAGGGHTLMTDQRGETIPFDQVGVPNADDGRDIGAFELLIQVAGDLTPPEVNSIVRADSNPTSEESVTFTVTFSEDVTGVDTGDFAVDATGVSGASVTGVNMTSGSVWEVIVDTGTGNGTLSIDFDANASGGVIDSASNVSTADFTAGESYTVNKVGPTVTINQAGGQDDPTNDVTINFTVVFSESVSDFALGDVSLSGTAGATTATVTGSGTTYNVAVTGMTTEGTVIATIGAGVATGDTSGLGNEASTSTDNMVQFDNVGPDVSVDKATGQDDPAASGPVTFRIAFSEPVTGFDENDLDFSGSTVPGTLMGAITDLTGGFYEVEVSGIGGNGDVVLSVVSGAAQDAAGNDSGAATLLDNSVAIQGTAQVVGEVFEDSNGDGQKQGGEPFFEGAVVELFRSTDGAVGGGDDISLGTRITGVDGAYAFTGLTAASNYYVQVRIPPGFDFTTQDVGDDATDSDVDGTGTTALFDLVDAQVEDRDAGLTGAAQSIFVLPIAGAGQYFLADEAKDAEGNRYIVGTIDGIVDFDPGVGTFELTSIGTGDATVAKYTPEGALVWVRQFGGTGFDQGIALDVDSNGNVITTGVFQDSVTFNGEQFVSEGDEDIFVWKLDTDGISLWVRQAGGSQPDASVALAVDPAGNTYVTGRFRTTASFPVGPGSIDLTTTNSDGFVWKLDPDGITDWVEQLGGPMTVSGEAIDADASHIYVAGAFQGTVSFGGTNLTASGTNDLFILKLDQDGVTQWATQAGFQLLAQSAAIEVDAGDVYVAGNFVGELTFGDTTLVEENMVGDGFVLKLDANGNSVWASQAGGAGLQMIGDAAVDDNGNVLALGTSMGASTFGDFTRTSNNGDVFVWQLDEVGSTDWLLAFGNTPALQGVGITLDDDGGFQVGGIFLDTADFDPSAGLFEITADGNADGFLIQLDPPQVINGTVWQDVNRDGQRQTHEPVEAGVVVDLFSSTDGTIGNGDDVLLETTTTNVNGEYVFADTTDAANYYVVVRVSEGIEFTVQDVGDDATDSDVDATGTSAVFGVPDGGSATIDAGIIGTSRLQLVSRGLPPGTPADARSDLQQVQSNEPDSSHVSADGRYVVFTSSATNLVPGQVDTNDGSDAFRLDRHTGEIELLTHTGDGVTAGNGDVVTDSVNISADGSTVFFLSTATDLVPSFVDGNQGNADIFRWRDGEVTLVSGTENSPTDGSNGQHVDIVVSDDGSTIVFSSDADDLIANLTDNNGTSNDIYLWSDGETTLVSRADGTTTEGGDGSSERATLSGDGKVVAFRSSATNLVSGFVPGAIGQEIYRWENDVLTLVSGANGSATQGSDGAFDAPRINRDGSVILLQSTATDLILNFVDGNSGGLDLFLWSNGDLSLASGANGSATQGGNGRSGDAVLSKDGTSIAFRSTATDLVPNFADGNGTDSDFYRWSNGVLTLISGAGGSATQGSNGTPEFVAINDDGTVIAFESQATDLINGFTPGASDELFVWSNGTLMLASGAAGSPTQGSDSVVNNPYVSGNGAVVIYESFSSDLVPSDSNGQNDVFAFALPVSGRVFDDANGNGQQDPAEAGIGGATVEIFRSDDAVIGNGDDVSLATFTTGVDGTYNLDGLVGTNLYIQVTTPQGFSFTQQDVGSDFTDSDVDQTGTSDLFTIPVGGSAILDAGVVGSSVLTLVSNSVDGGSGNGGSEAASHSGSEESRVVSDNGRYVVFESSATDLVPGQIDTNGSDDLFRYDRFTGETILITHTGDGVTTGDGGSSNPQVSADGSVIAFRSTATDLVDNFVNNNDFDSDIFRWEDGEIRLVSGKEGSLTEGANDGSALTNSDLVISADGSTIVYASDATDLVANFVDNNNSGEDLFRWSGGVVTLVSGMEGSATEGSNDDSDEPFVSADGNVIAFRSRATDLIAGFLDGNTTNDVFRWQKDVGVTLITAMAGSTTQSANAGVSAFTMNADGSAIALQSPATDLVAGFTPTVGRNSVYRWSIDEGLQLISGAFGSPTQESNNSDTVPIISDDGSTVVFESESGNLIPGFVDNNGSVADIYRWKDGVITLVSGSGGSLTQGANGQSEIPSVSADGRTIAFESQATDLVPDFVDGNLDTQDDIFVWTDGILSLASGVNGSPTHSGASRSEEAFVSANGAVVVYTSIASDLLPGDDNGTRDVFAYSLPVTGTIFNDTNANGQRDDNEPGLPGTLVEIIRSDDGIIGNDDDVSLANFFTGDDGAYRLDGLTGSNIYVKVTPPIDFSFTDQDVGSDFTDSDVDAAGNSDIFTLPIGGSAVIDAGVVGDLSLFLVSRGADPGTFGNDDSETAQFSPGEATRALSDDGRYIVFESNATNLVPGQMDNNDATDIFLFDRQTGEITLISHTGDGVTTGNGQSREPSMSGDGNVIVFQSQATDLVDNFVKGNESSETDIFRWSAGQVSLVSGMNGSATQGGNGQSQVPMVSGDGSAIVYISTSTDLIADFNDGNAGNERDIFRWTQAGTTLISHVPGFDTESGNDSSFSPAISYDGTVVSFRSVATDLVTGFMDGNGTGSDLYRWFAGEVTLVSGAQGSASDGGDDGVGDFVLSGDGTTIVFESDASNLVANFADNNGSSTDIYQWQNGSLSLISGANGSTSEGGDNASLDPAVDFDGDTIAFESFATNLIPGFGSNGSRQIFRWTPEGLELITGIGGSPTQGSEQNSEDASISRDGRTIAFESDGKQLIPGQIEQGNTEDAFVWRDGELFLMSGVNGSPILTGNSFSDNVVVSGAGNVVAFRSSASDLLPGDDNESRDVFGFAVPQPTNLVVDITDDELDFDFSPGDLSLREAIFLANQNGDVNNITFDPDLAGETITLTMGQLELTQTGPGAATTIIGPDGGIVVSGNEQSRILSVLPEVVAFVEGVTFTEGATDESGGAISNEGALTLTNVILTDNTSTSNPGGAIFNSGTLELISTLVANNSAIESGGGIFNTGILTARSSTIVGNESTITGAGISNTGTATLSNSLIALNTVDGDPADLFGTFTANFSFVGNTDAATVDGNNNASGDPRIVLNPDGTYTIQPDSPLIDAGDPNAADLPAGDAIGNARVSGERLDIGAIEFQFTPLEEIELIVSATNVGGRVNRGNGTIDLSTTPFLGFFGEVRVSSGDFNDDGIVDTIYGAGPGSMGGHVKVFDGQTGNEIRSFFAFEGFTGGVHVGSGDINNDGVSDIIVGADAGGLGGHVKVFDGQTGNEIRSFFAFEGFAGGVTVAGGDVDGDNFDDIIVGAGPTAPGGHVKVFSGMDGSLLRSFFAFEGFAGGVFVGAADLDANGIDEILVSAGAQGAPAVKVFADTDDAILSFLAYDAGFLGGVRVAGFDFDGDGDDEILTASGLGTRGHVKVFDADLTLLDSLFVTGEDFLDGIYVG